MQQHLIFTEFSQDTMQKKSRKFLQKMQTRRSVRDFSNKPVPLDIIQNAIKTAATAPSGANRQPWHFSVIRSADIKQKIRTAAEEEERAFYEHRASKQWLEDLTVFETNASKPFLASAPYLIAVFLQKHSFDEQGNKQKHYYTQESVGLAAGMLLSALHISGLATLTHTPSPMKFLNTICQRPSWEKPTMLIVTGYPTKNATVPIIEKKSCPEFMSVL